jgi:hypothetical protein
MEEELEKEHIPIVYSLKERGNLAKHSPEPSVSREMKLLVKI